MYLLEGQMGYGDAGKPQRTVGPKCAEVMNPTTKEACNLKKFLKYIWAPRVFEETKSDGNTRTVYKNAQGVEYKDAEGKPLTLQQIKDTKRPETDDKVDVKKGTSWSGVKMQPAFDVIKSSPYVDGTDTERLLPSAGDDYWKARSTITETLPDYEAKYPEKKGMDTNYKNIRKYLSQAKAANEQAYLARLKDFEDHRIKSGWLKDRIQTNLGHEVQLATKKIQSVAGPITALDGPGTLTKNTGISGFQDALTTACTQYREEDPNHWTALQSAIGAMEGAKCELPKGVQLK